MVSKFVTYSGWTLYYGLSTDELPKDVPNGSRFTAIDTDDEYWYDRENQGWYDADGQFIPDNEEEGDEIMVVNFSVVSGEASTEASFADVDAAITAGKFVVACVSFPEDDDMGDTKWWLPLSQTVESEATIGFEGDVYDFFTNKIMHIGIMFTEDGCGYMSYALAIDTDDGPGTT